MGNIQRWRVAKWLVSTVLLAASAGLSFLAWQHFYPVTVQAGWTYEVYLDDVPMVSALAVDAAGEIHFALEHGKGQGSIVKLSRDQQRQEVLAGLTKPDGLVPFQQGLAVCLEAEKSPVLLLRAGRTEPLFEGNGVEGLAVVGQTLFAVEDRKRAGRLLAYDAASRELKVLREGLDEAEGVAVCPDGRLLYAEKKKGWVKQYRAAGEDPVVYAGLNKPGFLRCDQDGLWIAEDATHGARLLLGRDGKLQTILSHLRSAQAVEPLQAGQFLVSEQGRGRILLLKRNTDAKF